MSAKEWEDFIFEWAPSLKSKYGRIEQCGGAGDLGRDILAFESTTADDPWDNHQCKHYDHPSDPYGCLARAWEARLPYIPKGNTPCRGATSSSRLTEQGTRYQSSSETRPRFAAVWSPLGRSTAVVRSLPRRKSSWMALLRLTSKVSTFQSSGRHCPLESWKSTARLPGTYSDSEEAFRSAKILPCHRPQSASTKRTTFEHSWTPMKTDLVRRSVERTI